MNAPRPFRPGGHRLRRMRQPLRRVTALLLLCMLLGRALIAPGFMPALNAESGEFVVTMCSGGGGSQTIHLDLDAPEPTSPADQQCAFATIAAAILTPLPVLEAALIPSRPTGRAPPASAPSPRKKPWPGGAPLTGPPVTA